MDSNILSEVPDASQPPQRGSIRFAGFELDLDGARLLDPSGADGGLTRKQFELLRALATRPGRVLSREFLSRVGCGTGAEPYERGVDMTVMRLRRRIEADPKQPRLIVTVPGLGYRFDANPEAAIQSVRAPTVPAAVAPTSDQPSPANPGLAKLSQPPRRVIFAGLAVLACIMLAADWSRGRDAAPSGEPPRMAVLPFANMSGDAAQDYFSAGVTGEVVTMLATFPGIRVVPISGLTSAKDLSLAEAGKLTGARYALRGGVTKTAETMRVTAQVFDTATGEALWADRFDGSGADPLALQADLADRIYQTVAGVRGKLFRLESEAGWRKSAPSLGEYDYFTRGLSAYQHFTLADVLRARQIFQEGLIKFPESAILRVKYAWSYLWPVMNEQTDDPRGDIERAWRIGMEVEAIKDRSTLASWAQHWLMAFLYQWRERDYEASVVEARAAVQMVPFDAMSRSDLSWILANAGRLEEATEWAQWSVRHDPGASPWYFNNLSWAYYLSGRQDDVAALAVQRGADFPFNRAVSLARAGKMAEARAAMAEWRKISPRSTIKLESWFPLIEPYATRLVDDMRAAGLPES